VVSSVPALIIGPESSERDHIGEVVRNCGLRPVFCPTLADACAMLTQRIFALVICSDRLPESDLGVSLKSLAGASTGAPVIVLSRDAEWDSYVAAIEAGAFDYITYPLRSVEAERILRSALAHSGPTRGVSHAAA
jgi:DNA-binding NtrC family response regulator